MVVCGVLLVASCVVLLWCCSCRVVCVTCFFCYSVTIYSGEASVALYTNLWLRKASTRVAVGVSPSACGLFSVDTRSSPRIHRVTISSGDLPSHSIPTFYSQTVNIQRAHEPSIHTQPSPPFHRVTISLGDASVALYTNLLFSFGVLFLSCRVLCCSCCVFVCVTFFSSIHTRSSPRIHRVTISSGDASVALYTNLWLRKAFRHPDCTEETRQLSVCRR